MAYKYKAFCSYRINETTFHEASSIATYIILVFPNISRSPRWIIYKKFVRDTKHPGRKGWGSIIVVGRESLTTILQQKVSCEDDNGFWFEACGCLWKLYFGFLCQRIVRITCKPKAKFWNNRSSNFSYIWMVKNQNNLLEREQKSKANTIHE